MNIVHVGPMDRTKGGISTVIAQYRLYYTNPEDHLLFVESHRDGAVAVKALTMIAAWLRSLYLVITRRIDIVHVHTGDYPSPLRKLWVCLPFLITRRPMILHFHGAAFLAEYDRRGAGLKRITRWFFGRFKLVICLSPEIESAFRERSSNRTVVLQNAVAIPDLAVPRRAADAPLALLFMGQIGDRKGVFDVLKALSRISPDVRYTLTVCGGGDVDRLTAEIRRADMTARVALSGWLSGEDKSAAIAGAHALVLTSYAEGMPMALLEAMSFGLPAITSPVGGIPDVVTDGANGLLVAPGDSAAIAAAIEALYRSEETRARLGEAARRTIVERYDVARHVEALRAIYLQVLAARARPRDRSRLEAASAQNQTAGEAD